jgi:hypothetical protein
MRMSVLWLLASIVFLSFLGCPSVNYGRILVTAAFPGIRTIMSMPFLLSPL